MGDNQDDGIGTRLGRAAQTVVDATEVAAALMNPLGAPLPPNAALPPQDAASIVRSVEQVGLESSAASTLYTLDEQAFERAVDHGEAVLEAELEESTSRAVDALSIPQAQETTLVLDDAEMKEIGGETPPGAPSTLLDAESAENELDALMESEAAALEADGPEAELDALLAAETAAAGPGVTESEAAELDALFAADAAAGAQSDSAAAELEAALAAETAAASPGATEAEAAELDALIGAELSGGFEPGWFGDPGGPGMEGGF